MTISTFQQRAQRAIERLQTNTSQAPTHSTAGKAISYTLRFPLDDNLVIEFEIDFEKAKFQHYPIRSITVLARDGGAAALREQITDPEQQAALAEIYHGRLHFSSRNISWE